MLYKTIISVSFLMGVALTTLGLVSLKRDVGVDYLLKDIPRPGNLLWSRVGIDSGNFHLMYAIVSEKRIITKRWTLFRNIVGELGFRSGANGKWKWNSLIMPLWIIVSLLFIQPTLAFMRGPMRKFIRRRQNQCQVCGYSRVGNESGICPECGQPLLNV